MKLKKAKQLIIKAYSELVGFKMADTMAIENYLVIGVKLGEMTAEQAANKSHDDYESKCTRAFEKAGL